MKNIDTSDKAREAGIRMPTLMPTVIFATNQKTLYCELEIWPL